MLMKHGMNPPENAWNGESKPVTGSARLWTSTGRTQRVSRTGDKGSRGTSVQKGCLSIPTLSLRRKLTFVSRLPFILSPRQSRTSGWELRRWSSGWSGLRALGSIADLRFSIGAANYTTAAPLKTEKTIEELKRMEASE